MSEWSVSIEATTGAALDPERLLEALMPFHAVVSAGTEGEFGVAMTLAAPDYRMAVAKAVHVVLAALELHEDDFELRWLEVQTLAEQHRRLQEPSLPPVVGVRETAQLLGVSRQRVSQLASESPLFPRPLVLLAAGPVWLRSSIDSFANVWPRRSGRPPGSHIEHPRGPGTIRGLERVDDTITSKEGS